MKWLPQELLGGMAFHLTRLALKRQSARPTETMHSLFDGAASSACRRRWRLDFQVKDGLSPKPLITSNNMPN
ncbi:hypothetical protein [Polaromonas sp. CG_9.11]|uniref:hypothetical protein n=1 Tax=Polaromonas sp. CG_9.11 TaxID=2787730 RepID=UPI0018CACD1B|nr:hypothetical protein [Polaromonas sp. CG_9.11]MBG6076892.1 hypothetical protein [Polaromonas sp. CG_9.11]